MSIIARVLRQLLPHIDEAGSEGAVRQIATVFSKSDALDHADLLANFSKETGLPDAQRYQLSKIFETLHTSARESRNLFDRTQRRAASIQLEMGGTPEHLQTREQLDEFLHTAPGFDFEKIIEDSDARLLAVQKTAGLNPEFSTALDDVLVRLSKGSRQQAPLPPLTGVRKPGDRLPVFPKVLHLPTGTVLEILSEPNPAREGTIRALHNEVEIAAKAILRAGEFGVPGPEAFTIEALKREVGRGQLIAKHGAPVEFLFDAKEINALNRIFSTDPEKPGALVQILDPKTPSAYTGKEVGEAGVPESDNNFVKILNEAGLPGAVIARLTKAAGREARFHEPQARTAVNKLTETISVGRGTRAAYVAATLDFLEQQPRSTPHQRAWQSYMDQRQRFKKDVAFRVTPGPQTDEPIVPPAIGLIQTIIDSMRAQNPKLRAKDILEPYDANLSDALDELRPPRYGMPSAPVLAKVGQAGQPEFQPASLLPLNHPSFDTNFKRELATGELVRLNPASNIVKRGGLADEEALYLVVDETAFLAPGSKKPGRAAVLIQMDPLTGGAVPDQQGNAAATLISHTRLAKDSPFIRVAENDPIRETIFDAPGQARKHALELRTRFAPTVMELGERGENIYYIYEPNGRPLNFTSERNHALEFARQGMFVRAKPIGRLTNDEVRAGASPDKATLLNRYIEGVQMTTQRRIEDLTSHYADLASNDPKVFDPAVKELGRALMLTERETINLRHSLLAGRSRPEFTRLSDAIAELPQDKSGRLLARRMRERASQVAEKEAHRARLGLKSSKEHTSLESMVADAKKAGINDPLSEDPDPAVLDEFFSRYFSTDDMRRIRDEMQRVQVLGGPPPGELATLARRKALDEALSIATSPTAIGAYPTSEIRQKALETLITHPELLGPNAVEQARAMRMLSTHAERMKKTMPFNTVIDELAQIRKGSITPQVLELQREQFLDQAAEDPAGFLYQFLEAHVRRAERKGLQNARLEINNFDDKLIPEITIIGHDPALGQNVRKMVNLTAEDFNRFQGLQELDEIWTDFAARVKDAPIAGGSCQTADVSPGER